MKKITFLLLLLPAISKAQSLKIGYSGHFVKAPFGLMAAIDFEGKGLFASLNYDMMGLRYPIFRGSITNAVRQGWTFEETKTSYLLARFGMYKTWGDFGIYIAAGANEENDRGLYTSSVDGKIYQAINFQQKIIRVGVQGGVVFDFTRNSRIMLGADTRPGGVVLSYIVTVMSQKP